MWHTQTVDEVRRKLNTNIYTGLNKKEVLKRRKIYGENKLAEKKKESIITKFISQFKDFMIIILLLASLISALVSYIDGTNDYADSIIIISIVVINAVIGVIQESKAEKSLEALKKLSSPTSTVIRESKQITIDSSQLVPGDIIELEAGNFVPADCRLIEAFNLKIEESALTGETVPILKDANVTLSNNIALGDMVNMAFSTTIVTNGHAKAIVTETGMNTKVGKIAKMIITDTSPQTPLQKKLSNIGKSLGIICIVICIAIFLIGLVKGISLKEMFMTSVGLAVAAIPEGLPAVVTIMLSIGVTKMARNNAIIRKLPAVETLGSSSIICSDKTGTLTQNRMNVVRILNYKEDITTKINSSDYNFILELGAMCNDCKVSNKNVVGEGTEAAIVNIALKNGINKNTLYEKMKRINEIPFDSDRKMMTTIHKIGDKYRIITKGAPDVILKKCSYVYSNGSSKAIDYNTKNYIEQKNESLANEALRVLAIAYKDVSSLPYNISSESIEKDLIFAGLFGMIDPPREGVKESIFIAKKAGIKTVMITGDHILTAKAIAKELGIYKDGDIAITGSELDNIPTKKFESEIMKYSVFARVSPEHKVKIVKAFQKAGNVVAMTGDGVNDAPALKNADIGVAMGKNGTDVAKNASDMILTDDNFTTIVKALKEGRHIYDNITKAVHFLISTNIGEIVTIFLGLILGLDTPLLAIHLLWINLVTDSFPAIGLGLEPEEKNIMNRKPKNPKKGIFSDGLWHKIFFEGCMIGILTLIAFFIGVKNYNLNVARTMAFITLGLTELIHSLNIRSTDSLFSSSFLKNKFLLISILFGAITQISITLIEPIANMFEVVPLNDSQWIYTILLSIFPIFIMETKKKLYERRHGKVVYNFYKKNA